MMQALYTARSDRQQRVGVASVATLDPFAFALRASAQPCIHNPLPTGLPAWGLLPKTSWTRSINSCAVKGLIM